MELTQLKQHWDRFGETDPLWAILTDPRKKDNQWNLDEFFATGRTEILQVMERLASLAVPLASNVQIERLKEADPYSDPSPVTGRRRALDFGCGVGRLTQAMCLVFSRCDGVDIAPSMVSLANRFNKFGDRCKYHLNDRPDLSLFPSGTFDFIYSNIVLQHMEPAYSKAYVREFFRVLAPDGILVFQIPSEPQASAETGTTRIEHPLPDEAFAADLTALKPAFSVESGSAIEVPIRVRNASACKWPAIGLSDSQYQIHVGNHWLSSDGQMLKFDDIRMRFPKDLEPSDVVEVKFIVRVPQAPGTYTLAFDLVQEQVAWFADKGASPAAVSVTVTPCRQETHESGVAMMEMYGVSKHEVLAVIEEVGGATLEVEPDSFATGWHGFRYYIMKRR